MKKFDIIVRGGYGLTNFGDDALLRSIHNDYLNGYSNLELAYSSTYAEYLRNDIGDYKSVPLNVNYNDLTRILIYGGGTQFYSFNKKISLLERIASKLHLLIEPNGLKKVIRLIKKKINNSVEDKNESSVHKMALGIGVGPFLEGADPDVENRTKVIFQEMDFVAVRDKYSLQKCKEWGVKNYGLYADLCFKMEHNKFHEKNTQKNINKIGIIVRDWDKTKEGDCYRENLFKVVKDLRLRDKEVHFIVFAKDKDPNWIKIIKDQNENLLLWNPDIASVDSFFTELSSFDLFITARYHGAIFSAMLGKPFITIAIEQKLTMISEVFSDGAYNWTYPYETEGLIKSFNHIDSNYGQFSSKIILQALSQKKLAEKMKKDLDFAIEKILNR